LYHPGEEGGEASGRESPGRGYEIVDEGVGEWGRGGVRERGEKKKGVRPRNRRWLIATLSEVREGEAS